MYGGGGRGTDGCHDSPLHSACAHVVKSVLSGVVWCCLVLFALFSLLLLLLLLLQRKRSPWRLCASRRRWCIRWTPSEHGSCSPLSVRPRVRRVVVVRATAVR